MTILIYWLVLAASWCVFIGYTKQLKRATKPSLKQMIEKASLEEIYDAMSRCKLAEKEAIICIVNITGGKFGCMIQGADNDLLNVMLNAYKKRDDFTELMDLFAKINDTIPSGFSKTAIKGSIRVTDENRESVEALFKAMGIKLETTNNPAETASQRFMSENEQADDAIDNFLKEKHGVFVSKTNSNEETDRPAH